MDRYWNENKLTIELLRDLAWDERIVRGIPYILEEINKAREALSSLQKGISASESGVEVAAMDIHAYLASSHSKFRDRIKYIKGFGD